MIKIMSFPFYFKLPAQRTYRTIASCNYIGSDVFHSFRLNALASTTAIDIYKRNLKEEKSEKHYLNATKFFCFGVSHSFASVGTLFENLIQLVNIVGSIFYGTVLGIFLVGFYIKFVKAKAILPGQPNHHFLYILLCHFVFPAEAKLGYLWLNFIGAMLTIVLSALLQLSVFRKEKDNIS
jgi:Na+/proline symporter